MVEKNVVLTREQIEAMRGFYAIMPEEEFQYVPVCYRDEAVFPKHMQPLFTLRPISGEDAARFGDLMRGEVSFDKGAGNGSASVKTKRGDFVVAVCQKGIVRWDNYFNDRGDVIKFEGSIKNIPYKLLEELSGVIIGRASLTEEELLGLK